LYYLDPALVKSGEYVTLLRQRLHDPDAGVVTNVIMVLNEMNLSQGGMELSQDTVTYLLNRIGDFSEWGLNVVLELIARYRPSSEDEMYAVMNLLDPVLRTANSGAVLAAINSFLRSVLE
jgi:vesicle coat complex subunit